MAEDKGIASLVAQVRAPLFRGPAFKPGAIANPFGDAMLRYPIDTVVGETKVPLYRSNFSDERMPAAIEGSSHNSLTDAFRQQGRAQLRMIIGVGYGTAVAPGPIKLEDLYHFLPVGAQIARGELAGMQIKKALEENPRNTPARPGEWINGWTSGISGLTANFDPEAPQDSRVSNMRPNGKPLRMEATYTVAGLWYKEVPALINMLPARGVVVVKDEKGAPLDGTDVVKMYLDSLPGKALRKDGLQLVRTRLVNPLTASRHGIREVQPARGSHPLSARRGPPIRLPEYCRAGWATSGAR